MLVRDGQIAHRYRSLTNTGVPLNGLITSLTGSKAIGGNFYTR